MGVTAKLLDHLQASLLHGVDELAHQPLRYSHPFPLHQLSQVSQSVVFCDSSAHLAQLLQEEWMDTSQWLVSKFVNTMR
jgi:hypothetical protein